MPELLRAYGRLVDRTGQPAPGVGVVVLDGTGKERRTVAATVSDANGGFFVELPDAKGEPKLALQLSTNEDPIPLPDPSGWERPLHGPISVVIENPPPAGGAVAPRQPLLLDERTMVAAWKKAPGLFTRPEPVRPADPCSPRAPADVPARVFYLNQVAVYPAPAGTDAGGRVATHALSHALPANFDRGGLRYGALTEYRQEWWDFGTTLGNLLYSVPLAPCEQTKIAQVDWRRRDRAVRETSLDERHDQDTTVTRDQSIDEAVRLISEKEVSGDTKAGGIGATIGPFSGGYSETSSNAAESVDASTNASRTVNDRIQQVSNVVRNTRAFGIAEVTQEEESRVATRVIRNHNHSHTLTFQYFEVLQVYMLRTRVNQIRPVVLVPFQPLTFTEATLQQHGYLLRRALLDSTLAAAFDRYLGVLPPAEDEPASPAVAQPDEPTGQVESFQVTFQSAETYGPGMFSLLVDDAEYPLNLSADLGRGHYTGTPMSDPPDVPLASIRRVGLRRSGGTSIGLGEGNVATLDGITIDAVMGDERAELAFVDTAELGFGRSVVRRVAGGGAQPAAAPAAVSGLARLLAHLNANPIYYSSAILGGGDAGLRYLMLTQINDPQGRPLADLVDNVVVGGEGNYLAFPLRRFSDLPELYRGDVGADDLIEPGTPHERLITIPTPGVFAESQLGHCNASEKIDDTRFWNWQTSPCPDEAPDITADMLASRYQDLSGLMEIIRSELEPKVTVPELPEPMITIGDETLKELVSGLELPDAAATLGFIEGLAKVGSEHSLEVFKTIWSAYTGKAGGPGAGGLQSGQQPSGQQPPATTPQGGGGLPATTTV